MIVRDWTRDNDCSGEGEKGDGLREKGKSKVQLPLVQNLFFLLFLLTQQKTKPLFFFSTPQN